MARQRERGREEGDYGNMYKSLTLLDTLPAARERAGLL